LPKSFEDDLAKFREETQRFKSGAISAAEYRSFRVPRGVYEQREADTYMLRARCPAGAVLPEQMRALASVSRRYGNGVLHLTTRQDIQVHRVLLDQIHPALVELHTAGLSTRGGGGNTVRNITGCCDAGVCAREAFDISPYVIGLTESLLPDPLSYQLPRKYKIAFSGCPRDCAAATVNDLGFIAKERHGTKGFAVYVGGGMGAESRTGQRFAEFVPAEEIHLVAEAVKRVFDQHGNRKNRQKARIRFLVEHVGLDRFRELYEQQLAELRGQNQPVLDIRPFPQPPQSPGHEPPQPGGDFLRWRKQNVVPQKQDGYYLVQIPLFLGDIDAEKLDQLSHVVERFGERAARATQWQNFVLRWIHAGELPELYDSLAAIGLADTHPPVLRNLVACTGASTCKLGICLSRGLARATRETILSDGLPLEELGDLKIQISGCPNSCGRHPLADIGFFGAARRVKGRLVPHYVLQLGGKVSEGETQLAQGKQAIPARNVPALVGDLLAAFARSVHRPDFRAFLHAEGQQIAESLARKFGDVPDFETAKEYYVDWGTDKLFSLAGRGPGECGAGVFDLIEVDLESAREALRQGRLLDAVVLAARSLLVTRGQQAQDDSEVLELFAKHFVEEKLVDASAGVLIAEARQAIALRTSGRTFQASADRVSQFVETIEELYASMDASLRFKPVAAENARPAASIRPPAATSATGATIERQADFRGVVCPLNYVKTKMLLGQMKAGETLAVLLDEPGTRNVPQSVEKDGHEVLSVEGRGDHWKVLIRKSGRL
jgi:sulfite reductase (ferredoxin)